MKKILTLLLAAFQFDPQRFTRISIPINNCHSGCVLCLTKGKSPSLMSSHLAGLGNGRDPDGSHR